MGMCGTRPFFLVGPGAGPEPTRAQHFQNMPMVLSAFSLLGAPQAPGNTPPWKGVNVSGEGPLKPKEISRYRDTLSQICAADNTAGRSATRQLERCRPILICLFISL